MLRELLPDEIRALFKIDKNDIYFNDEEVILFWKEMYTCKGQRKDGKDGKCINVNMHNHGCFGCIIGDGGLCEPELL